MNDEKAWDALSSHLTTQYGMRIRFKNESPLMRLVGKILFFNPKFMTDYVTTIGRTIYFPTREDILGGKMWNVLAHEGVHLHDSQKHPWTFKLSYLFPQILALLAPLSFLAFKNTYFLLFLVSLLALLPLPAPWRVKWERRGYMMSMCADILRYGESWVDSDYYLKTMTEIYTGPGYYFMQWGKVRAEQNVKFDRALAQMIVANQSFHEPFATFTDLIRANMPSATVSTGR